MLTSLNRLVGMPVVWQLKQLGYVERGVPDAGARRLTGVVVRRGIGAAKWIPSEALQLVGRRCVLVRAKPEAMPENRKAGLRRVYLTSGQCVGEVADAVLGGHSLRMIALEVSQGPLYRLMGRSAFATDYRVVKTREGAEDVVVSKLLTWAELRGVLGEEDER